MSKFAIEIKTKDFAMESKDFDSKEEAESWFKDSFKLTTGEYKVKIIQYNSYTVTSYEQIETEALS